MKTYLVGGAVRDQLLHYPHHERDWVVVGATPDDMIARGFQPVGKDFPVFLHPDTREEYALARTERKIGLGYTGFACHTTPEVSLEEDLLRRDLTINAMAQDDQGNLIDPYHGRRDLEAKVLRHVSPAFVEDPLRVLRVARFAARYAHLDFRVAPETLELMRTIVGRGELDTLPGERLWKEMERALGERSPQMFFTILQQCGAFDALLPELASTPPATFSALAGAAGAQLPTTVRFALLANNLDEADVKRLCEHIKAPNEYRQLALLIARLGPQLAANTDAPDALLEILEQADAFRRPERFEAMLQCGRQLFPRSATPEKLVAAVRACHTVDPGAIAAQGLKGKAVAEELRRRRIDAIQQQRH